MLVSMKEIVDAAYEGHYCVPGPIYFNSSELYACVEAAEALGSPIILQIARLMATTDRDRFRDLCRLSRRVAERASVPCCINLDHGGEFKEIVESIEDGCTSVMVDRSYLPYEENVAEVQKVVQVAHAGGVTVEAELGHVGTNTSGEGEGGQKKNIKTEEDKRALYTDPHEAARFAEETGIDCLAVAVGTVHGLYPEGFKPSVDVELLGRIHGMVSVPLVIHGGSGSGDEILKAIAPYTSKLNVGSDLFKAEKVAVAAALERDEDPILAAQAGYRAELEHYIRVLGCEGKA